MTGRRLLHLKEVWPEHDDRNNLECGFHWEQNLQRIDSIIPVDLRQSHRKLLMEWIHSKGEHSKAACETAIFTWYSVKCAKTEVPRLNAFFGFQIRHAHHILKQYLNLSNDMTAEIQRPYVCLAECMHAKWRAWGAYNASLLEAVEFDCLMQVRQICLAMTRQHSNKHLLSVQARLRALEDKWVKNVLSQSEFRDGRDLINSIRDASGEPLLQQRAIPATDTHRPDKVTHQGVTRKRGVPGVPAAANPSAARQARPERASVRIYPDAGNGFNSSNLHLLRAVGGDKQCFGRKSNGSRHETMLPKGELSLGFVGSLKFWSPPKSVALKSGQNRTLMTTPANRTILFCSLKCATNPWYAYQAQ